MVGRARVVVTLTMRYGLWTRRAVGVGLLASVLLILAGSLAAARVAAFNMRLFEGLASALFLQVILIFVTLVNAAALIREEIEDHTLPYLLTRPISKPEVVAFKYVGYLACVLVFLVPPLLLAYAVTVAYTGEGFSSHLDVLGGLMLVTLLACMAYGALFLLLSILLRRPLAVGLLIGFVWESIVSSVPGDVPKLSVIHYLRSIMKAAAPTGAFAGYTTDLSLGQATTVLTAFSLATLILSMVVFQRMEFGSKA